MYLERDNVTDRLQKSVYIYTSVITDTDTGSSCHNPVKSRLIPLDSSSIPLESSRFLWNPVESGRMDAFLQEFVGHQKVQQRTYPEDSESVLTNIVAVHCHIAYKQTLFYDNSPTSFYLFAYYSSSPFVPSSSCLASLYSVASPKPVLLALINKTFNHSTTSSAISGVRSAFMFSRGN